MYVQDSFAKNFADRSQFMSFLDEIEERADWMVCPTDSLYLTAAEMNPAACRKMKQAEDGEQLLNDTRLNTGLFIKADGMDYPLGTTAMKTLQNRARIYGNALQDMDRPTFAGVLNDCLQVTSGQALLRLQEGKIRAVHGGDPKDYAVLPMPEIFEAANLYLEESYGKVVFSAGYFSHELVTAAWQLQEPELLDTYRDLLLQYGEQASEELSACIRVQSSDVASSGANICCFLQEGPYKRPLILGSEIKLEHTNGATVEKFFGNLTQIFSCYQESIKNLERLFQLEIHYPDSAMEGTMKKVGIGKQLITQTVEHFRATHGTGKANGYELYCGICEAVFFAQCKNQSAKNLIDLEDMVARCLSLRFEDYDFPGEYR